MKVKAFSGPMNFTTSAGGVLNHYGRLAVNEVTNFSALANFWNIFRILKAKVVFIPLSAEAVPGVAISAKPTDEQSVGLTFSGTFTSQELLQEKGVYRSFADGKMIVVPVTGFTKEWLELDTTTGPDEGLLDVIELKVVAPSTMSTSTNVLQAYIEWELQVQ